MLKASEWQLYRLKLKQMLDGKAYLLAKEECQRARKSILETPLASLTAGEFLLLQERLNQVNKDMEAVKSYESFNKAFPIWDCCWEPVDSKGSHFCWHHSENDCDCKKCRTFR